VGPLSAIAKTKVRSILNFRTSSKMSYRPLPLSDPRGKLPSNPRVGVEGGQGGGEMHGDDVVYRPAKKSGPFLPLKLQEEMHQRLETPRARLDVMTTTKRRRSGEQGRGG